MEVETCPMDEKYRNYEKLHLIEYDEITGEEKTNFYREYRNENGGEIITERYGKYKIGRRNFRNFRYIKSYG